MPRRSRHIAAGTRLALAAGDGDGVDGNDGTEMRALGDLDVCEPSRRQSAVTELREEIRGLLLGYDVDPARAERIVALFEGLRSTTPSAATQAVLATSWHEVALFADLERLFVATPRFRGIGTEEIAPSHASRLRAYVRRMRAGGAGIAEEFLEDLRRALAHYGVAALAHGDVLERALLRLFATQNVADLRGRLVRSMIRGLARGSDEARVVEVLRRIAGMRELVSDALADAAIEAEEAMLAPSAAAGDDPFASLVVADVAGLPLAALHALAAAPRPAFERLLGWLGDGDPRRHRLALAAYLVRLYAPFDPPIEIARPPQARSGSASRTVARSSGWRSLARTATAMQRERSLRGGRRLRNRDRRAAELRGGSA
jgi:hypothetical protein